MKQEGVPTGGENDANVVIRQVIEYHCDDWCVDRWLPEALRATSSKCSGTASVSVGEGLVMKRLLGGGVGVISPSSDIRLRGGMTKSSSETRLAENILGPV